MAKTLTFLNNKAFPELLISQLRIYKNGQNPLIVKDPVRPEGKQDRKGDYFIGLPSKLVEILPGSFIKPLVFLKLIGVKNNLYKKASLLTGDSLYKNQPLLSFEKEKCVLNVFHGSTNPFSLSISTIAIKNTDFKNPKTRALYQKNQYRLMLPILRSRSDYKLRIIEDCLATGETIIGVLSLILKTKSRLFSSRIIRVDVTVATVQGILLLFNFAIKNKLKLELNVGFLAFGLSRGEKISGCQARIHANYITYPKEVFPTISDKLTYVVGDMGDAGKSLPDIYNKLFPWNGFRRDRHGDKKVTKQTKTEKINKGKATVLFLANGGYLMRAFFNYTHPESANNQLLMQASRIWSVDKRYGYGVLILTKHL